MNKKLVFCGGGNMAEGIIRVLLSRGVAVPECITVSELVPDRRTFLSSTYGITAVAEAGDAIKIADMVVVAVNPYQVPSVTQMLKPLVADHAIVLSIAAAITLGALAEQVGENRKIARVVPNTLGQSGNGYSAVCVNARCTDQDKAFIDEVLGALGQVMHLPEGLFNAFSSFSNVGPLWCYKMIEALVDAGVYVGFNRQEARNIVIKNMVGVACVLEESGDHPVMRVDRMTSPGGVTIESLRVLQQEGFATALMNSVIAGFTKTNALE
ncbi:MAG: pyrroline-5-carboxylate reductase [Planctomycetaceae bacterium]|nr:pyrroline-5-carboxylate reductase [Planctomycetaceae bacterium]